MTHTITTRTKIVATLGPASESKLVLAQLLKEGVNIIRLNFAHGDAQEHRRRIINVRKAADALHAPIGILQDLPGPKIRVGSSPFAPFDLKPNDLVRLVTTGTRTLERNMIAISYARLSHDLKPGHAVFIADGLIRLQVKSISKKGVIARVTHGGTVRPGNGVNMPDSSLTLRVFTTADQKHLAFGLENGVDFVGVSFVGDGKDLDQVRAFCRRRGREPFLIAKIERRQALRNLEAIADKCDGLMVARGDLGVEVPFAEIPGLQKQIVSVAHKKGKPVIVATQVLESMIQNPRPTRAEATDIANAVREEADAVMLSGETAAGKYPIESARALNHVIAATEKEFIGGTQRDSSSELNVSDIVAREACDLAEWAKASLIVVLARSGSTAVRVSRFRPSIPVLALVNEEIIRRRLSLYWGIQTISVPKTPPFHNVHAFVRPLLLKHRLVKRGQIVVLVGGAPGLSVGETGLLQVLKI
jgi:pyruvate kinase